MPSEYNSPSFEQSTSPVAKKYPVEKSIHGRIHVDPYNWIRAENWREVMADQTLLAADIRAYIEEENTYTEKFFKSLNGLPEKLVKELRGRIKENDQTPPVKDGSYLYKWHYTDGADFPQYLRAPTPHPDAKDYDILLDGQQLYQQHISDGASYFNFGSVCQSPDHTHLLYCLDLTGHETYDFFVKTIETEEIHRINTTRAGALAVWGPDNHSFYYTVQDENLRPYAVMHYNMFNDTHKEVYRETDPRFFVGINASDARDHLIISSHTHNTTELWISPFADDALVLTCLSPRETGHEYSIAQTSSGWFINTNQNGAEDFSIFYAHSSIPNRANWQPYLPHRPGILIEYIDGSAHFLTWIERQESTLRLYRSAKLLSHENAWQSEPPTDITPTNIAAAIRYTTGHDFHDERLRICYSTMKDPTMTVDIHLETAEITIVKTQTIPSGHNPEDYKTESLTAISHDGAHVPISLIYHKDTAINQTAPVLLYGYGSYGHSLDPAFNANQFSLIDRGVIYALAHCRGGMDKGYNWYKDSLKTKKKNSFHDFIACANELIIQGYSSAGRIIAQGGSAGGMLVGASGNMTSDLFAGIIAQVPFVDCLNTMLDDSLPLTPPEWEEWGNPLVDESIFDYIQSYAPYENIQDKAYPFIFATGGLADPRVTYWEPVKWIARLRDIAGTPTKNAGRAFYLDIDMSSGHGGVPGRLAHLNEIAKAYAFALAICYKLQIIHP